MEALSEFFHLSKKEMCVSIERYDERFRARSDITAKPRSYVGELRSRTGKRMPLDTEGWHCSLSAQGGYTRLGFEKVRVVEYRIDHDDRYTGDDKGDCSTSTKHAEHYPGQGYQ
jgi:hypothetical protein